MINMLRRENDHRRLTHQLGMSVEWIYFRQRIDR